MRASEARPWAMRVHQGQLEPTDESRLAHIRRVAQFVPPGAQALAWYELALRRLREAAVATEFARGGPRLGQ